MINQILNKDCFEVLPDIADKSIDMILTDPPYAMTACHWDVKIDLDLMFAHFNRVIKDNGAMVIFGSQPFTTDLICANRKYFKQEIIWQKDRLTNIFNVKNEFGKVHENIIVFSKEKHTYNPQKKKGFIANNRVNCLNKKNYSSGNYSEIVNTKYSKVNIYGALVNPISILKFNRDKKKGIKNIHTTQKPVKLFEYLIKTYTNENDLILDSFSGSGTTAIAAHKLNRKFICIEKDKDYFDKSVFRYKEEIKQGKLFDVI